MWCIKAVVGLILMMAFFKPTPPLPQANNRNKIMAILCLSGDGI
jgi:hypothetical protein